MAIKSVHRVDEADLTKRFLKSGKYPVGTLFCRSSRLCASEKPIYWFYKCPVCSADKYTAEGLCNGVFESSSSSLLAGILSCRCSKRFHWTKEQREYQITTLLKNEGRGDTLVGFDNGTWRSRSNVTLNCAEHGNYHCKLATFFEGGRCQRCSDFTFDITAPSSLYVIEVKGDLNFCGYGISNNVINRLRIHRNTLRQYNSTIHRVCTFDGIGKAVKDIETAIKRAFTKFSQPANGFSREATLLCNYQNVVDFVERELDYGPT